MRFEALPKTETVQTVYNFHMEITENQWQRKNRQVKKQLRYLSAVRKQKFGNYYEIGKYNPLIFGI